MVMMIVEVLLISAVVGMMYKALAPGREESE
jgi:hypothetical protein